MATAVVALLRGPLSSSAAMAEAGLRAIANLATDNDGNSWRFRTAGSCKGACVRIMACVNERSCCFFAKHLL